MSAFIDRKLKKYVVFQHSDVAVSDLRWDSIQAEGFPRLHSLFAAERCHPGPGGESKGHPGGPGRLSRLLQQLRHTLPEPGTLCGGNPQLFLWLWPICLFWSILWERYAQTGPVHHQMLQHDVPEHNSNYQQKSAFLIILQNHMCNKALNFYYIPVWRGFGHL